MATVIEKLQQTIATTTDPTIKAMAQQELDRIMAAQGSASAPAPTPAAPSTADQELATILAQLKSALSGVSGKMNPQDVEQAIRDYLATKKVQIGDLSQQVMDLFQTNRPVTLAMQKLTGVSTSTVKADFLDRPLTQLILSDYLARNNVYLYGGAGTGKTFIAEAIADMLKWERITLNCNQFTSPLDILGGQTIDGYQEGKLSMAWSNNVIDENGNERKVDGCVLILDELPKIDPNTAGILNEALAKVKDFKYDEDTDTWKPPTIRNGKNKELPLGNLFVIATGNVPLNTIDPDYEANFKQDLSLQDRFIGSTYRVYVDAEYEFKNIMKGFAFIWIFLFKLRMAIEDAKATGQAFVSLRIMTNVKATYKTYRDVLAGTPKGRSAATGQAISKPKTIIESMDAFFGLFKTTVRDTLMQNVDYDGFKKIVNAKNKMTYDPTNPNFDTPDELVEGQRMVDDYKAKQQII